MNNRIKTTILFSFIFGVVTLFHTTQVNALFENIFTDAEAARKLDNGEKLGFFEKWQGNRYKAARAKKLVERKNKRAAELKKMLERAVKERDLDIELATADKAKIYANFKAAAQSIRKTLTLLESSSIAKPAILKPDEVATIKETFLTLVQEFEREIKAQEDTITAIIAAKKEKEITSIPEAGSGFLSDEEEDEDDYTARTSKPDLGRKTTKRGYGKYGA